MSQPDEESRQKFMKNFVSAQILAAMTGGRHHVDVAVLSQNEKGQVQVRVFETKVFLGGADRSGRQDRINKITSKTDGRAERHRTIREGIRNKLQAKFQDGTLQGYEQTLRQMKQDYDNGVYRADGVNPNRQGRVQLEALGELPGRANSFVQHQPQQPQPQPEQNEAQNGLGAGRKSQPLKRHN